MAADSAIPSVEVEIRARLDSLEDSLNRARSRLNALDDSFSGPTRGAQQLEVGSAAAARAISERLITSLQAATDAQARFVRQLDSTNSAVRDLAAANDNAAGGFAETYLGMQQAKAGLISIAVETLRTVSELKLLGLALYALIPAFRGVANTAIKEVASGLVSISPTAASVAIGIIKYLGPALAFLSRLTPPILLVVAAFKLLMDVVNTGASLLSKYGSAQRGIIAGVDENLAKLTRFQEATMSAGQVKQATELGARLAEANRTIDQFLHTQLDVTNAALDLQRVWVSIVETIASAVNALNRMPAWAVRAILGAAGGGLAGAAVGTVVPGVGTLVGGAAGAVAGAVAGAASPPAAEAEVPLEEALRAAHERLAAGLGSTTNFAVRFGQAINDLASPLDKTAKSTAAAAGEFDRLKASMERSITASEADIVTLGKSAGEQAAYRAELKLTEAAKQQFGEVTDDVRKKIDALTDRIRLSTQALAELKLKSDVAFEGQTALLGSVDQQIANRLRAVYGDAGWKAQMNGAVANQIRFNDVMRQTGALLENNLSSGIVDVINHTKTFRDAFRDAGQVVLRAVEEMIIKMLVLQPLLRALGGLLGGGGIDLSTAGVGATGPALGKFVVGHSGGMVGSLTETRYMNPAYFDNAPRFAAGLDARAPGINEVPVLAHRGEVIGWPDQMRRAFGGREGDVNVKVVVENHGADVDVADKKRNADGSVDIRMAVRSVMQEDIARGQYDGAMSSRYGARVATRRV